MEKFKCNSCGFIHLGYIDICPLCGLGPMLPINNKKFKKKK